MPSYLTPEDVSRRIPQVVISANSVPNEAQVAEMILDVEREGNAKLSTRYEVPIDPVTSPVAWGFVRDQLSNCLAARVLRAMHTGINDGAMSGVREFQRLCEAFHADLLDDMDAVPIPEFAGTGRVRGYFGEREHAFRREDAF